MISLKLKRTEHALLVKVLAQRPFVEVFELIGKIHKQTGPFELSRSEVRICLLALRDCEEPLVKSTVLSMHKQLNHQGWLGNAHV